MRKIAFLLAPILTMAALVVAPAEAKGGKGYKGKGKHGYSYVERRGPPAWTPAHGYRRKAARSRYANRFYPRSYSTTYSYQLRQDRW